MSFAFPENVLRSLVPDALEVDTHEGLGFVTVAMVWTKKLRPAGFPRVLGHDFFLAGYRVFTRLRDESGRKLRGLFILRSETGKQRMVLLGNLFTGYHYRHVKLSIEAADAETRVKATLPDGSPTLNLAFASPPEGVSLPEGSPFRDWHTARLFAGPMPFTFSREDDGRFVVIEGSRQDWAPRPVRVLDWQVSLFHEPPLRGIKPILANAFVVEGVSYRWEKGRMVKAEVNA